MRRFETRFVPAILCMLLNGLCARPLPADDPPNIVLIFADDQGYGDLGCFGSETISTPRIDRMAEEGMRFTSFYAQAVCGPSRAALMTGCYPIRVAEPGNRKNQHTIPHTEEVTLGEVLREAGYATGCIGKWHLGQRQGQGWNPATMPNGQGFDEFFGTPLFNGFTVFVEDTDFRSPLMRNGDIIEPVVADWNDITRRYTEESLDFIRRHRDGPFFLYLAHNMPHIPLGASEDFRGRTDYGPYGDAIEEIDWSTGKILDELDRLGIDDRTLVIYTSDNGPWIETTHGNDPRRRPFIPPQHSGTTGPLRGYKMLTWDGGLRVPCVMRWPGHIPAGAVCDEVAATIDVLPTLTAVAGGELPAGRTIDGGDLRPLMFGESGARSPREAFYYYCYTNLQAVRSGRWKLVLPRPEHPAWTGWSGRFVGQAVTEPELFDLEADVGETHNVAAAHPDVVDRLMALVEQARDDLGDYDRIGIGARFFDDGPRRPDMDFWKKAK